jgi:hypothetical protein
LQNTTRIKKSNGVCTSTYDIKAVHPRSRSTRQAEQPIADRNAGQILIAHQEITNVIGHALGHFKVQIAPDSATR